MKKRLRKKLRLKEFQQHCFRVRFTLKDADKNSELVFEDHMFEMLDANALMVGGSLDDFYVYTNSRPLGEADRAVMQEWLAQQAAVTDIEVGPLVDAWYGVAARIMVMSGELPNTVAAHILATAGISY